MLNYQNFAGTTYRILGGHGHLFILTSKAIYVIADLASRLVQPRFDSSNSPVMTLPVEAVDAAIVDDKWLLIVMPDSIRRYDLAAFDTIIASFVRNDSPSYTVNPSQQTWNARELAVA